MSQFEIPLIIKKVLGCLEDNHFEGFIVGGAVRDLLSHFPVYDWDFTTLAKPEEIQKLFPESFYDNNYGTVGITIEKLLKQFKIENDSLSKELTLSSVVEITTFRCERGYSDKRHPDKVIWGKTLFQDLQRRDFTINAMAIKIQNLKFTINNLTQVEIIDPFEGQKDLKNKLIRAVGNPLDRFSEDALRMMRAIRIASQLNFSLEKNTKEAIKHHSKAITEISPERVRDELFKTLKTDYPAEGVKMFDSSGLLLYIMPELVATKNVEQAGHHTKDVWNHSLDSLASLATKDPLIRLATLLHDIGKAKAYRKINNKITFYGHEVVGARMVENIAERLKFKKKDREKLKLLVRLHMFSYNPNMTDKAIRRFIKKVGRENINDMMMLRVGDRLGGGSKATSWRLQELQQRIGELMYTPLQVSDLKVNGNDVMKLLAIKPGPKVGEILNKLFEEVMEDAKNNNREYLLKRIKEL